MKFTDFASLIRLYTATNSTTFTDANILIYANIFKNDICDKIIEKVGEDYFGLRFTRDLIAGQREYDLPTELVKMKYLEAKLDGENWSHLTETDLSIYAKGTDEETIVAAYADRDPQFDLFDRSLFILSGSAIIDVTDGLKLWAIIYPADFASLTSTEDMANPPDDYSHGFPSSFHELLARRISIAYKSSKERPIPLSEKEVLYEADLKAAIDSMKVENEDRSFVPSTPHDDGSDY